MTPGAKRFHLDLRRLVTASVLSRVLLASTCVFCLPLPAIGGFMARESAAESERPLEKDEFPKEVTLVRDCAAEYRRHSEVIEHRRPGCRDRAFLSSAVRRKGATARRGHLFSDGHLAPLRC